MTEQEIPTNPNYDHMHLAHTGNPYNPENPDSLEGASYISEASIANRVLEQGGGEIEHKLAMDGLATKLESSGFQLPMVEMDESIIKELRAREGAIAETAQGFLKQMDAPEGARGRRHGPDYHAARALAKEALLEGPDRVYDAVDAVTAKTRLMAARISEKTTLPEDIASEAKILKRLGVHMGWHNLDADNASPVETSESGAFTLEADEVQQTIVRELVGKGLLEAHAQGENLAWLYDGLRQTSNPVENTRRQQQQADMLMILMQGDEASRYGVVGDVAEQALEYREGARQNGDVVMA